VLGAAVLADPQEDDPVDDPLDREVQRPLVQPLVADGQVGGEPFAPVLDLFEEGVVEFLRPAAAGGAAVAVEGSKAASSTVGRVNLCGVTTVCSAANR